MRGRWDPCIEHRGPELDPFIEEYFGAENRKVLLVAGAGFDPRSTAVSNSIGAVSKKLRALLVRENRPDPDDSLLAKAVSNAEQLQSVLVDNEVLHVEVFGTDQAVIGGRNVIAALARQDLDGYSDVVVDISALSVGVSYPVIRYFVERARKKSPPRNVHIFVSSDPIMDDAIVPVPIDTVGFVHGFKGRWALDSQKAAAKLWLPQLAPKRNAALQRIYDFLQPHDTCPILPFPAKNPRAGDELAEQFLTELESTWRVDTRNLVYAAEDDPLDLYRTLLRIDDRRQPVYQEVGGSLLILSPMGSKVLALGALMAALERDFPVMYSEAIAYEFRAAPPENRRPDLIHIWLEGDTYIRSSEQG